MRGQSAIIELTLSFRRQSILHGSQQAKDEGEAQVQQHSKLIGRNKVGLGSAMTRISC